MWISYKKLPSHSCTCSCQRSYDSTGSIQSPVSILISITRPDADDILCLQEGCGSLSVTSIDRKENETEVNIKCRRQSASQREKEQNKIQSVYTFN